MAENTNESGVIDITNIAESLRTSFVSWASAYLFAQILTIPGLSWLRLPLVSTFFKFILNGVLNILTKSAVMEAFFLNTSVRKASQATDYVNAVTLKNNLPQNVSDEDYEKAEQNEMAAFNSFVTLGN